ncbi:MAG: DUF3047 domain-containing protein [Chitinispirillaceae bacterium]
MKGMIAFSVLFLFLGIGTADELVIDTFSNCFSDKFPNLPCGWGPSQKWRNVEMYSIRQEQGNHFIKARTDGGVTTIGRPVDFSLDKYPTLSWNWRVHSLPEGGNESIKEKGDSGAAVYVIFKGSFFRNHILKYVWSAELERGTLTESPYNSRTKIVVLRSGEREKGKWVEESVDLLNDYRRLFKSEPPPVVAIAIMSDGDNTKSLVEADYDDFRLSGHK